MTKAKFKNQLIFGNPRHRAVCAKGDYTGAWKSSSTEAYQDALDHQNEPGKHTHRVTVFTEQSVKKFGAED